MQLAQPQPPFKILKDYAELAIDFAVNSSKYTPEKFWSGTEL